MHGCEIQKYEYHSRSDEEGQENSVIGSGIRSADQVPVARPHPRI